MTDDRPEGFTVTNRAIYDEVVKVRERLDERIRKLEVQIAAQWVVVGLVIVGLGAVLSRALTAI